MIAGRRHDPARAEPSALSLSDEVKALERAHDLASRDPAAALRELDRYRTRFPGGALAAEETVVRVQALLARGDDAKARALASGPVLPMRLTAASNADTQP